MCLGLASVQLARYPSLLTQPPLGMTAFLKGCNIVLSLSFRIWSCIFVIFILLSLLSVSSIFVTPCVLWLFFCCLLFGRLSVSSWLCYVPFVSRLLFGSLFYKLFFLCLCSCLLLVRRYLDCCEFSLCYIVRQGCAFFIHSNG